MEPKTGKVDGISLKKYHSLPGWSKSRLDKINRSPAHRVYAKENPKEPTPAQVFGSALHCMVLTPDLFKLEYAVAPKCDKRTNEGKIIISSFESLNAGKEILSSEQFEQIEGMKAAIFSHPLASQLLKDGEAEKSFFWIDEVTELQCKARPDYFRNDGICIDIKTTTDATFKEFQRDAYNFRYHVQAAFFMDGIYKSTKLEYTDFVIIAIEKEAPYGIIVYRMDEMAIDVGRDCYYRNLQTAKEWEENPDAFKTVYKISEEPIELTLPRWAE